jgi:MFS family permease
MTIETQPSTAPVTEPLPGAGHVAAPSGWAWLPKGLRSLAYRDYRMFWVGGIISNTGTWMAITVQAWVVYDISGHDPRWLGYDTFAAGLPVLLTPLAGVVADRTNPRRAMVVLIVGMMGVSAYLAAALAGGWLTVEQVIICSLISGTISTFNFPMFFSIMPELVQRKDLPNAVALNALQFNLSRVIGPVVGGVVLHHFGSAWGFGLNAMTFIAVLITLALIHPHIGRREPVKDTAWQSFKQGAAYLRGRADLLLMLAIVFAAGTLGSPMLSMTAALCREALGREDESSYAWLVSAFGVGAVVGAAMLALRSHRAPKPWWALWSITGIGICQILLGSQGHYTAAMLLYFVTGLCFVNTMARVNTAVTASIPTTLRGRISSMVFMALGLSVPIGSLIAGELAKQMSVRTTYVVYGVLLVIAAAVMALIKASANVRYLYDHGQRHDDAARDAQNAQIADADSALEHAAR